MRSHLFFLLGACALLVGCGSPEASRELPSPDPGDGAQPAGAEGEGEGGAAGLGDGAGDQGGGDEGGDEGGGPGDAGDGGPGGSGADGGPDPCRGPDSCEAGQACDEGVCVDAQCEGDADCPGGGVCQAGLCLTLPRACADAADRPAWTGIAAEGDLAGGGRHLNASCAETGASSEIILAWEHDGADSDLVLAIDAEGFAPVVSLLSDCEGATTVFCQRFDVPGGRVALPSLPEGPYWVVVDGLGDEADDDRRFRLTISEAPVSETPGGETCALAEAVAFDDQGTATLAGDLIAAVDDAQGCETDPGSGDWFYRFTVPEDSGVSIDVGSDSPAIDWSLWRDCAEEAPVACHAGPGAAAFGSLPAGEYRLALEGTGPFRADLALSTAPPTPSNDSCGAPQRIRIDDAGPTRVAGDTSIATDGRTPTCGGGEGGGELTYRVDLPATRRLRASVQSPWGGVLSVRDVCGGDAPDLACAPRGEAIDIEGSPQARTLHLVVDTDNGVGGPFALTVESLPPAAGDTCDDPMLMQPAGEGIWRAEGSTAGQADTFVDPCEGGGGGPTGPDVYLAFEVAEAGSFFFGLQAPFDATLHLLRGACAQGDRVVCNDDAPEEQLQSAVTARNLAPGNYWLVVDGLSAAEQGPFTLIAERLDPPANGVCADAAPIDVDAESGVGRVAGSLRVAADSALPSCAERGWGDVWYSLDLAEASSLRLRTSPEGGQATVAVGVLDGECGGEELGCEAVRPDQGALFLPEVGPGLIPIFVEGPDTATFELVVQVAPAVTPPPNESCDTAEEIVFDEEGVAAIEGQIVRAADDHAAACGGEGPDAAYVFDLDQARQVRIARTPAIGDADLFVSAWGEGCAGDHLACTALAPNDAADDTRLVGSIGPGRVWLVVEGGQGADLGYALTLSLHEPVEVPGNDQCGGAILVEYDVEAEDPEPVELRGNTELADNDYGALCAGLAASPDVVYEIEMVRPGSLDLIMEADGGWDNALHLRSGDCHDADAEIACNDDNPAIGSSRITRRLIEPGTYYVIADGYLADNAGAFTLTVDVGPEPQCPEGEEIVIPDVDDPEVIGIEGTTEGAEDSVNASCASGARSPDVMYHFTLDRPRPLTVVMDAVGGWDNALHLRAAPCVDEAAEIACNDDDPNVGRSQITVELLQPGQYFLFADGYSAGNSGPFNLGLDFGPTPPPPDNDTCEAPTPLPFDGPVSRTDLALIGAAADAAVCADDQVDVFYRHAPAEGGAYSFAVASSTGHVSVGAECGVADAACAPGAVVDAAEGPRHVWVSASEAAAGELVALVGPPAQALEGGDDCDGAMGLPAEGLLAIHGTMAGASDALDHADPLCPAAGGGPDRVFGIFAQAPTRIRADVVGVGFEPHVWLRGGQCDDGPLLACGASRTGWSTVEADVDGGLVTLVVDSLSEDAAGDFLLRVHATPVDP